MRYLAGGLMFVALAAWGGVADGEAKKEEAPKKKKDVKELSLDDLLETPIAVATKAEARTSRDTPGVVTTMSREEIVASGARDLLQLLELIPGFSFHVDVEGVVGSGFRGMWGHEGKVLLIVDGIEMNELLYSTNQFGNHFPVQIIERVEVIRGPGSAVYGGNAELAVINVITRSAKELMGAEAGVRYSQSYRGLADRSIGLSGGWAFEGPGVEVAFNLGLGQGTRGHGYYSDFAGNTYDMSGVSALDPAVVNLNVKWKGLGFRFLYDDYRVQSADGYGDVVTPVVARFRTVGADLRYRLEKWERFVPTAYFQWRLQVPWETRDKTSDLFYTKTAQRLQGGLLAQVKPLEGLEALVGVEAYADLAWLNDPELVGTQTDFHGSNSVSYSNVAAFAQVGWDNPWVNVSAGGRLEWHSKTGVNFAPRIALSKRVDRFHLKALYSGAFRSPGIENINLAVGTITAEQTQVGEAELGMQLSDNLYAGVNAYYMKLSKPIVYGVDPVTSEESYVNAGPIATAGWELELQLRGKHGFARATYSLVMPVQNEVEAYQVPGHTDSILGFAAHKVTVHGLWRVWRGLQLGGSAVYFSERFGYLTPGEPDSEGNPVGLLGQQPATLNANVWVGYENLGLNGLSLSGGVDNLFNAPIAFLQPYNAGHAPLSGTARAFYVRLTYAWHSER